MNYERFKFLNSFEKLTALIAEFKKENLPELTEKAKDKADTFAFKLYQKTASIFDEVNYLIQMGHDIRSRTVSFYLSECFKNKDSEKELQVLKLVGDREYLSRICSSSKLKLEIEINKVVNRLALEKQYPQLENKKNFEGIETIKKIQKVSNSNNN